MNSSFHPEADEEFLKAVAYYEECDPGLGIDFSREVFTAIHNAVDYPRLWPEIEKDIRRCLVHRFPYGVLYSIELNSVFVLAVMHLHRDPAYGKHRKA